MLEEIKILLIDDHTLVRAGIKSLLDDTEGIKVVAESGDGAETIPLFNSAKPDIVLLDITLKELNGLNILFEIKKADPGAKVIILSMHEDEELVLQAIEYGAAGYLLKDSAPAELEIAIKAVINGGVYLGRAVSKFILKDIKINSEKFKKGRNLAIDTFSKLTERQKEVFRLIAEGIQSKEIANQLNISIKTVDTHRFQIMKKLNIHDVTGIVRFAFRAGILKNEN